VSLAKGRTGDLPANHSQILNTAFARDRWHINAATATGEFMLRNLRSKILAILLLPTLIIAGLAVALVVPAFRDADRASYASKLIERVDSSNAWSLAVANELSSTLNLGAHPNADGFQELLATRKGTDVARQRYVADLTPLLTAKGASDADKAVIRSELNAVKGIDALRASLTSGKITGNSLTNNAIAVIRAPNADLKTLIKEVGDLDLARTLTAHLDAASAMQYMQIELSTMAASFANQNSPLITRDVLVQALQLAPDLEQSVLNLQDDVSGAERAALTKQLGAIDMTPLSKARLFYPLKIAGQKFTQPAGWTDTANARLKIVSDLDTQLRTTARDQASALADSKKQHAELLGLIALLMLFFAFLQGLVLSRRVTRPLRALTSAAGDIATELPVMVQRMQAPGDGPGVQFAPLPVKGKDEIGRLAKAFNEVNETTVRVALEQAALRASIATMFVNVARRNQALLGRQLSVLERLEQHEDDADTLEDLFQVDHLTTRMQRNAESLLVLAGIDTARRSRHPLLLSDVIRTAISEIEEYPRVDLEALVDPQVDGRHVLVTAHLLAELLENATRFSDPATRVEVRTYNTNDAIIVSITDHGLGMPQEDLELARHKMSLPPASEIAFSDRLGFYVVGRLARRLGAVVSIAPGANGGTVVAVALPVSVLARTELPATPAPAEALPPTAALAELALPELTVAEFEPAPVEELSAVPAPRESVSEESLPARTPVEATAAAPAEAAPPAALPARDILPARGTLQTRSFLPSRSTPTPAAEPTTAEPAWPAATTAPVALASSAPLAAPAVEAPAAPVMAAVDAPAPVLPPVVVEPDPIPASWQPPMPAESLKALAAEFGYTPTFAPSPQDTSGAGQLTARTPRPASDAPDPLAKAFGTGNTESSEGTEQPQDPATARRDAQAVRTNLSSFRSAVQRARGDATDISADYQA
jgi:signal transduction histidine kinase